MPSMHLKLDYIWPKRNARGENNRTNKTKEMTKHEQQHQQHTKENIDENKNISKQRQHKTTNLKYETQFADTMKCV